MTLSATNFIIKQYLKTRQRRIQKFVSNPIGCQLEILDHLITQQKETAWGKKNLLSKIDQNNFKEKLPISSYEDLYPWIVKMINGESNILHPKKTTRFAKSSGTSNSDSKYIPLTQAMLTSCHDKASWDLLSNLYHQRPETKIFTHKNLIMAGSVHKFQHNRESIYGDISAITLNNLPPFSRPYYTPDFETALLDDWEQKLDKMVKICSNEEVTMLAGVPSWTLILLQRILEYKGGKTMEDVWQEASIYIHGGVGFEPYRSAFNDLFPSGNLAYQEVYNASEGFFAFQNDLQDDALLLMLDHGVYYEFIPSSEFNKSQPSTIELKDVELDKVYALVITTLSGLTRYRLGDTIKFTSLNPFKIKVVGREKQFINAFGEELMVHNAEAALATTCEKYRVRIKDYTVAPHYISGSNKGAHQWLIEFESGNVSLPDLSKTLDQELQSLNADYKAKRKGNLVMEPLKVTSLPQGTFLKWMKVNGKLGGQHKVPRLSNDRIFAEEMLSLIDRQ